MKLELLDTALCRTPAFSTEDHLGEQWNVLKEMIRESSPSFYQVIADLDIKQLERADPKIRFSVWKYFNRARFRATPYGSFATFSSLPVMSNADMPLVLASGITRHQFVDWKEKDACTGDNRPIAESSLTFQTNSTLYPFGQDFRYVRLNNGIFEIASVSGFAELTALLRLCRKKTSRHTLHCEMKIGFNLNAKEVDILLSQMLSLQLLLSERSPNITGPDYFERLDAKHSNFTGQYIISERKPVTGGLDVRQLSQVREWISWLSIYLPHTLNPSLINFRNAFLKKFEHCAVPLMRAIDPETGVSYDNLGEQQTDYSLTTIFDTDGHGKQNQLQISYTELHRFLLNKLIKGGTIRLEDFSGIEPESTLPLPNTLSLLFHLFEGHPVIENAGGCTANALLGRFTIASQEFEQIGRQISLIEANANPDVLFFDIAYQAEKVVDNVNRRKQLYEYELPILTWSCEASPLTFEDILVAVRGAEIVLWSKKYQRRMVPRIPSAYNYSRSDLAVFRFLCDLQHQQIKSDLNFNMQHFFPRLSFYPRVMFKEMIVSPAMWMLPQEVHQFVKAQNLEDGKKRLIDWLRATRVNSPFKAGHADQTLCFDPTVAADVDAFFLYCRQNIHTEIYISEALISDSDAVFDVEGKKYAAQIIANYSHPERVYQPIQPDELNLDDRRHDHVAILPGAEWLYFEIYCHPVRSNGLLLHQISSFLKEIKSHINKWFFIRYEDPAPHIRLRLHLIQIDEGYRIISLLRSLLEQDFRNGVISDIQVKTYFPETVRYGSSHIDHVENLFFSDSIYILGLLEDRENINQLYAAALVSMQHMVALTISDVDGQLAFAKNIADNFSREYELETANFKKLNKRFQELKNSVHLDVISCPAPLPVYLQNAISAAFSNFQSPEECRKLLADIIHMHVNRLFNTHQRAHEAILYHYLVKMLTAGRAQRSVRAELGHTISK